MGIRRSTYYYRISHSPSLKKNSGGRPIPGFSRKKDGKRVLDSSIKIFINRLLDGEDSIYGYRKLTRCLQRKYKLIINKKKVYRLCKEMEILLPQREKKNKHPRRISRNHMVTGPNQLWQLDIKYGYIAGSRRFFFLASAIDVFDRTIVGIYKGTECKTKSITRMLQKALLKRGIPSEELTKLVIRTDNGPQFCSKAFYEFCEAHKGQLIHERIPPKSPNYNAYIESFHSVLERECFQRHEFRTLEQAYKTVDDYIDFYNKRRIHGSLFDRTPKEFLKQFEAGLINHKKPIAV